MIGKIVCSVTVGRNYRHARLDVSPFKSCVCKNQCRAEHRRQSVVCIHGNTLEIYIIKGPYVSRSAPCALRDLVTISRARLSSACHHALDLIREVESGVNSAFASDGGNPVILAYRCDLSAAEDLLIFQIVGLLINDSEVCNPGQV
jgi:hypothetical protein